MTETYSVDIENYSHLLFGLLAIQRGFIDNLKLLEALEVQKQEPEKKIGIILNQLGHIQMKDVFALLKEQGKFREKKPHTWPYIPDTVLKGLVYFSEKPVFRNITAKEILAAQKLCLKYQEENRYKTVAKILIEDMGLTTIEELKSIQNKIVFNARACSGCLRLFSLYNYDESVKVACPVCTGKNLDITVSEWKKKKSHEEIVQAGLKNVLEEEPVNEPEETKFAPRATMALASFYERLEKEPEVKPLQQDLPLEKNSPKLNTTKAMPSMKSMNVTRAMPQSPLKKNNVTRVMAQSPLKKKDSKEELQELYKNLDQKEQDRQIKKQQKVSEHNKKIKLKEGFDTVFSATQRQGQKKVLKAFAICMTIMLLVGCFLLFYGKQQEDGDYRSLIVHEIEENAPPTIQPQKVDNKKIEYDIAQSIVKKHIKILQQTGIPNQDVINNILRSLHENQEQYTESGDFWNLVGRLYLYKIFIDREEQILLEKRILLLKKAAFESLEKASANYREAKTFPSFKMDLSPWMPENFLKLSSLTTIRYSSNSEAMEDTKKLINNIQLICDLTQKY